jgi:hypothetical protein
MFFTPLLSSSYIDVLCSILAIQTDTMTYPSILDYEYRNLEMFHQADKLRVHNSAYLFAVGVEMAKQVIRTAD